MAVEITELTGFAASTFLAVNSAGNDLECVAKSAYVTLTGTQTLTNKTLTSPTLNTPTISSPSGLVKADVGLGNVDNTSDANKPVSTATQTALDLKANLNSPTLVTPVLGVATATSINKLAITAPATGATLAIADGKTFTVSNTLTFTGTDSSSVEFGAGGTVAYNTSALITGQTAETTIADDDLILISDTSASGALRKMTKANFVTGLGGGSVAGSNKQIQFNNSSAFGGATGFEYQSGASPTVLITQQSATYDCLRLNSTASVNGDMFVIQRNGTDTVQWNFTTTATTLKMGVDLASGHTTRFELNSSQYITGGWGANLHIVNGAGGASTIIGCLYNVVTGVALGENGNGNYELVVNTQNSGASVLCYPRTAANVGLAVRGFASQTANLLELRDSASTVQYGFNPNIWQIQKESSANPTTSELTAGDHFALYRKADKFVIAYNNGGTMNYLVATLDGSTATWSNSTTAP